MTLTISQPCLESTELCLTSMVAASACLKFCCQQKHVCAQVPTLDEGDAPEGVMSSWAPSTAWTLPIPPSLVSPGVWTHPAHRLVSHIRRSLLETDTRGNPHPHKQGKDSGLPEWDGRGDLARAGTPLLLFCSFRQRARGLSGGILGSTDCISTHPASELSQVTGFWEGANSRTSWLSARWLGAPLCCEAWRTGFHVMLGSVARK